MPLFYHKYVNYVLAHSVNYVITLYNQSVTQVPLMSIYSLSQSCPRSIEVGGICYTLNLSFDRVLSAFELLSSDELEGIDSFDVIFDWFVIAPKVKNLSTRVDVVNEIFD